MLCWEGAIVNDTDLWMPWYVGDWRRDTAHLSATESGAYREIIDECWVRGGAVTDSDRELWRIARADSIDHWRKDLRPVIAEFFSIEDGVWRHKRVDEELAKAAAQREAKRKQTEAARAARGRVRGEPTDTVTTPATTSVTTSVTNPVTTSVTETPSPSPIKKESSSNPAQENCSPEPEPPETTADRPNYAFEGRVIRLNQRDYDFWKDKFKNLDLDAELASRDSWLATEAAASARKKWFNSTATHLKNVNERNRKKPPDDDEPYVFRM